MSTACGGPSRLVILPSIPDKFGFAGAFAGVHAGQLLAAGGANFPDGVMPWNGGTKVWHDGVFALDPAVRGSAWRSAGRLPAPNGYGVSLTVQQGVLLIGGGNATRHFSDVRLMTYADGKLAFRDLPALPTPLAQLAGAVVGGHAHVVGGIETPNATSASARHFRLRLDAMTQGWEEMPPLPEAGRILATAAGIGDAFYVVGGCSLAPDSTGKPARMYLRDAWRFSGGVWTQLPDMPRASAAAASPAPVAGRSVYVVSGDDGSQVGISSPANHRGFTSEILRYDADENTWHRAGELAVPAPVTLPTAPWKGGSVFVSGEVRPGVRTPQVFLFLPAP